MRDGPMKAREESIINQALPVTTGVPTGETVWPTQASIVCTLCGAVHRAPGFICIGSPVQQWKALAEHYKRALIAIETHEFHEPLASEIARKALEES